MKLELAIFHRQLAQVPATMAHLQALVSVVRHYYQKISSLFRSYSIPSGTFGSLGNVDTTDYQAGLGLRAAVAANTDFNLSATYLNTKASFLGISGIYTGYATSASFRALVAPKLEASIGVSYYDTKNERFGTESGTQYRIGTGYRFSENIMGRAGYVTESEANGYSVTVNYMF